VITVVGDWVRAGSAYVVHDADEFVGLGDELVELAIAGDRAFGAFDCIEGQLPAHCPV